MNLKRLPKLFDLHILALQFKLILCLNRLDLFPLRHPFSDELLLDSVTHQVRLFQILLKLRHDLTQDLHPLLALLPQILP